MAYTIKLLNKISFKNEYLFDAAIDAWGYLNRKLCFMTKHFELPFYLTES